MSHLKKIVLTPDRGYRVEGWNALGETIYPGMILQIDPTQTKRGNRFAWKIYDRGADGDRPAGPYIVATEDIGQGKTTTSVYDTTVGSIIQGFIPLAGCELNLLYKNVTGTADDVAAGDLLIVDDGTGKMLVTTGGPESEPAMALEALVDPTADALVWCHWSGL